MEESAVQSAGWVIRGPVLQPNGHGAWPRSTPKGVTTMTARGLRIVPDEPDIENAQWCCRETEPGDVGSVTTGISEGSVIGEPAIGETVTLPAALFRLAPSAEERRWTTEAICADGDPDRLFVTGAAQREAAKLCRNCPVQMECLADALDNQVEFGVWGGLTERQRRALLKRRPDITSWRTVLKDARNDARRGVAS